MIRFLLSILLVFLAAFGNFSNAQKPCFDKEPTPWADSVFQTLSLEEKIGQLFMIAAWSDPAHKSYDANGVQSLINKYHIGGLIFMQGSPARQAILTNKYQSSSRVPLLISMDAEWGLGMRLDSTIAFPRQMTLGASCNDLLTYEFGEEMARQCKRIGVHVSFSPVVDINNNPGNPVISNRAFGEDRFLVTQRGLMYMHGLQDNHVLAVAKHFPGHGDTDTDSHKDLPVIPFSRQRLDSLELYPYRELLKEGLGGSMIAHLFVPALDSTPNLPSTLSPKIVNGVLREEMGFQGLVFTDALNMQGVAKFWKPGDMDVQALIAGNDVLLFSANVGLAVDKIKAALEEGKITIADIDAKVMRILKTKEWAGLDHFTPIQINGIYDDLNNAKAKDLQRRLVEESLTVVRNEDDLIPLHTRHFKKVAVVEIGASESGIFSETVAHYMNVDRFTIEKTPEAESRKAWINKLSEYDLVIAAIVGTSNKAASNFGVSNEPILLLNELGKQTTVVLSILANPYSLTSIAELKNIPGVIIAYQDEKLTRKACGELMVGALSAEGKLPVTANSAFICQDGCSVNGGGILRWATMNGAQKTTLIAPNPIKSNLPGYQEDMMSDEKKETFVVDSKSFANVDSIALDGIRRGTYPGCRVLMAKDGLVLYDKAFGVLDDKTQEPVDLNTVYDLASITKVASGTIAAMKLVDMGKLDVNATLGTYLDIPENNAYHKVVIKDMLSHCAGFTAWIPFYTKTMSDGKLKSAIYKTEAQEGYSAQVAEGIYIQDDYKEVMFQEILKTPISSDKSYKYSDLAFYFTQHLVEKISGQPLDEFVTTYFYDPMNLQSIGYNPLTRMDRSRIAPTEDDQVFRDQHIRGYVHDQGAAMQGGVAGHAGVFSTAQDLAAIMQMLLNQGLYGGKRYITKETIDMFNTRYFQGNRRGLGFDKPAFKKNTGSTCAEASAQSFGHTGFTGTMCWADPANGMVYVFLSNRVNPDAENKLIQSMDIRTKIQHEFYKAISQVSH